MHYNYNAFNQTTAQLKTINHFSLYCVSPACFGQHMANVEDFSNSGI